MIELSPQTSYKLVDRVATTQNDVRVFFWRRSRQKNTRIIKQAARAVVGHAIRGLFF